MKLVLNGTRIMIALDPVADKVGAIYVPSADSFRSGTIVAVGKGRFNDDGNFIKQPFNEGDRVVVISGIGTKVSRTFAPNDADNVVMCDADAVIALITKE